MFTFLYWKSTNIHWPVRSLRGTVKQKRERNRERERKKKDGVRSFFAPIHFIAFLRARQKRKMCPSFVLFYAHSDAGRIPFQTNGKLFRFKKSAFERILVAFFSLTCIHTYEQTFIHTYSNTHIHAHMHTAGCSRPSILRPYLVIPSQIQSIAE